MSIELTASVLLYYPKTQISKLLSNEKKRKDITIAQLLKGEQSEDYYRIKRCYILLGDLLVNFCRKSLAQILSDMIFQPIGMINTSLGGDVPDVIGYDKYSEPVPYSSPINGADGAVSTIDDMLIFYDALLNGKILKKPFSDYPSNNEGCFFGGFFKNGTRFSHSSSFCFITTEIGLGTETNEIYIDIRNKEPFPENGDRLMYYVINGCDDGYVKFEVWTMDSNSDVMLNSVKIFDEKANELYSLCSDRPLINVRNNGEQRHASDFCTEGYYYELNLSEILGDKFDSKARYIAELRAECHSDTAAQLGLVYRNNGEWISGYLNVFSHDISAYPLFMEALNIVT